MKSKYGINIPEINRLDEEGFFKNLFGGNRAAQAQPASAGPRYQIDPAIAQNQSTDPSAYDAARNELHGRIRTDQQEAFDQYLRSQGVEDPSQGSIESVSLGEAGEISYYTDGSGNTVEIPQYLDDPNMFADIANKNPNIDMNDPSQVVNADWTTIVDDAPVPQELKRVPGVNVDPENDESSISDFIQNQEQQRLEALAQQDTTQEQPAPAAEQPAPAAEQPAAQEQPAVEAPDREYQQAPTPQEIAAQDTAETEQTIADTSTPEVSPPEVADTSTPEADSVVPAAPEVADDSTIPDAPDVQEMDVPDVPEPDMPDIEPPTPTDIPPIEVPEVVDAPVPEPTSTETPTEEVEAPVAEPDVEVPTEDVAVPTEDVAVPTDNIEVPDATDIPDDPSIPEVDMPDPTEDAPVTTGDPAADIASMVLKMLGAAAITYGGAVIAKRIKQQGDWNQASIVQGEQAGPTLGAMMTPVIKGLYQAKDPKERNRILKGSLKQAKVAYQTGNSKWVPLRSWEDLRQAASALQSGEVTAVARQ